MTNDEFKISVLLFGILRDRAGVARTDVEVIQGATVADACGELSTRFPAIRPYLPKIAFAVNQHYVSATTELHAGDELALLPPVSGG